MSLDDHIKITFFHLLGKSFTHLLKFGLITEDLKCGSRHLSGYSLMCQDFKLKTFKIFACGKCFLVTCLVFTHMLSSIVPKAAVIVVSSALFRLHMDVVSALELDIVHR